MDLSDILPAERVLCEVGVTSKKRALELVSEALACNELAGCQGEIFDSLIARERLGSTGFGHGVAIPHGRVKSAVNTLAVFVQLAEPVDYDAIDGESVDLLFALVVPEKSTDEHLQVLAKLAEMFSNRELCQRLRDCKDYVMLHELITCWHKDN